MTEITIEIGKLAFLANIFPTPTGQLILDALPFRSNANTWGDEIYFQVPARTGLEPDARAEVSVGDLAYWPTMPAFCIFFGPTPVSTDDQPRAASAVNIFGKLLDVNLDILRSVRDGESIRVSRT